MEQRPPADTPLSAETPEMIPAPEIRLDGAGMVEQFLQTNAALFGEVEQRWRGVGQAQIEVVQTRHSLTSGLALNRQRQRLHDRVGIRSDHLISGIRNGIDEFLSADWPRIMRMDTDERETWAADLADQYRNSRLPDPKISDEPFEKSIAELQASYFMTALRQGMAIDQIRSLLSQDEAVAPFIVRLHELSELGQAGMQEVPGLLPVLATHVAAEKDANIIRQALLRVAAAPGELAPEFLRSLFREEEAGDQRGSKETGARKHLTAALGMISIASKIIQTEFGGSKDDVVRLFADRYRGWPPEFGRLLETYATNRFQDAWQAVRQSLSPFVREGRLPSTGASVSAAAMLRGKSQSGKQPSGRDAIPVNKRSQDIFVVADPEAEDAAAPQLAVFKVLSRGKVNRLRLESVDGVNDLMDTPYIQNHIRKHPHQSAALGTLIGTALNQIADGSVDPRNVRVLENVSYLLEDDTGARKPRRLLRFRPQYMPGVETGGIAGSTRILFARFKLDGQQHVVLYGAYIKQDIDNIKDLPAR